MRIEFASALYHVTSRGNERPRIVKDDTDRSRRLDWLRRTVETYGWYVHAFGLMDNHDHPHVLSPDPDPWAGGDEVLRRIESAAPTLRRGVNRPEWNITID